MSDEKPTTLGVTPKQAADPAEDLKGKVEDELKDEVQKSNLPGWLKKVLIFGAIPFLGFCGQQLWSFYGSYQELKQEVHDLQQDQANSKAIWDSIAENRNRSTELKVDVEVLKKLLEIEFGKRIPQAPKPSPPDPVQLPSIEPPPPPKIIPPEELRKLQEQKFPPPSPQKK